MAEQAAELSVGAADGITDLLQRAVDEAARLLHTDGAMVYLADARHEALRYAADAGIPDGHAREMIRGLRLPVGHGMFGTAVAVRDVVVTADYPNDATFTHNAAADRIVELAGIRSMAVAPLVAGDEVLGALGVFSTQAGGFEPSLVSLLRALADHAAAAIANARLLARQAKLEAVLRRQSAELERELDSQRRLLAINERLLAALDLAGVFELIVEGLKQVVAYDNVGVYRVDAQERVLRPVLARDRHAAEVMAYTIPFGPGLINWAVAHRAPLLVNDALNDPRAIHIPGTPADPEAIIIVPLVAKGEVLGALNVGRVGREEVYFSEHDFELVQLFAGQAAIAVANARLYEELQESERRYRYLVDHAPDVVWAADADGRLTFLSETLTPHTGWRPEQLLGEHVTALVDPRSEPVLQAAFRRLRRQPTTEQRARVEIRRMDQALVPAEITMLGRVVEGRFAGAHGSLRDVSERERLEASLRRQAAELAASAERANLARELHDSVTQTLFSMGLTVRTLELLLDRDIAAARRKIPELSELQRDALAEMRALIFELRPASLEQEGLWKALRAHAAAVQGRSGLSITVEGELAERLPLHAEEALYRIVQEALHNVVKHANAARATVHVAVEPEAVRLRVVDDGGGFDPAAVGNGQLGLVGMRQRADQIGADLDVRSEPGKGTRVEVRVPWRAITQEPTPPA